MQPALHLWRPARAGKLMSGDDLDCTAYNAAASLCALLV